MAGGVPCKITMAPRIGTRGPMPASIQGANINSLPQVARILGVIRAKCRMDLVHVGLGSHTFAFIVVTCDSQGKTNFQILTESHLSLTETPGQKHGVPPALDVGRSASRTSRAFKMDLKARVRVSTLHVLIYSSPSKNCIGCHIFMIE